MSETLTVETLDTNRLKVTAHPNYRDESISPIVGISTKDGSISKSVSYKIGNYFLCTSAYQLTCVGQGANPPSPSNLPGIVGNNSYQSKIVYYKLKSKHEVTTPIKYQSATGLMGYFEPFADLAQDCVYGNKIRNASTMNIYLRIPQALVNFLTTKKFIGNIFFDRFPDDSGIYTLNKTVTGTNPAGFTDEIKNASTVTPTGQYSFYIDCDVITTNTNVVKHFTFDCGKTIDVNIHIEFL